MLGIPIHFPQKQFKRFPKKCRERALRRTILTEVSDFFFINNYPLNVRISTRRGAREEVWFVLKSVPTCAISVGTIRHRSPVCEFIYDSTRGRNRSLAPIVTIVQQTTTRCGDTEWNTRERRNTSALIANTLRFSHQRLRWPSEDFV